MYVSDLSLSNNVWGRLNKAPSREAHTGTHRGMSAAASVDDAVTERQSFDDVDELFIDDTDQDGSLDKEHMQTIRLLLQRGNAAFRKHRFEEAVEDYTKAYKLQSYGLVVILSNRSAALCRLSEYLRNIPAAVSERNALYGQDPTYHAEVALKDAEKVVQLNKTWPKAYYRKGIALQLLERYEEAQQAFLEGLHIDPSSAPLQDALQRVDQELKKDNLDSHGDRHLKRTKLQHIDDFDCILCLKLLYDPVTTPCGHSFCRPCLRQAMDHGNKCPICRVVLLLSPKTYPVSVTLKKIIEKNFPEEYETRKRESNTLSMHEEKEILPFFVMDFLIPTEKMSLNIFEPRYRLMVRRVMEGNHKMGMVGIDPESGTIADVACEVEIVECQTLVDGRFYLEIEGRRRCKIIHSWEQDGYRVGEISWFQDTVLEGPSLEQLQTTTEATANLARTWITEASQSGIMNEAGGNANTNNPERFSFWVATLLHLRPYEKLRMLRLTDTGERLAQVLILLHGRPARRFRFF